MLNLKGKTSVFVILGAFLCSSFATPAFAANSSENEKNGFYRYDLLQDSSNLRLKATSPGEQFGTTMTNGDFNGDGRMDLAVGSPFYSHSEKKWVGKVSLFFGGIGASDGVQNLKTNPSDVVFRGANDGDQFGSAVSSSDINGDGIADLIVSAYRAESPGSGIRAGQVYIFYGKQHYESLYDTRVFPPDVLLTGNDSENSFGIALASGDFNGDEMGDVAITSLGARFRDLSGTGKVHILYGGAYLDENPVIDLNEQPLQTTLYGQENYDYFGATIGAGDIDGDGKDDVLVSSYFADNRSLKDVGKVYVYHGFDANPSLYKKDIRAHFVSDFLFVGGGERDWFGFSLTSGDLNKDGKDDVIVGAFPFAKSGVKIGKVYVIYGRNDFEFGETYKAAVVSDLKFFGEDDGNILGASVAVGDFNGDRSADLLLGAPGEAQMEGVQTGKAYVFYGGFEGKSVFNLNDEYADVTVEGINDGDWFGNNVVAIDFNYDKVSDLAVASMYSDYGKTSNTGEVSIIYGKKKFLGDFKRFLRTSYDHVKRGEFIRQIIDVFELGSKKKRLLDRCMDTLKICLFNFSAESRYDDIRFEPNIILYPDVYPAHPDYKYINMGTMLGLLHGYMTEPGSPFKSDKEITRIQALKVILGASGLLDWKYKSELMRELGGFENLKSQISIYNDIDARRSHMWWYPRYINYAYLIGIIVRSQEFRPDDPITKSELDSMILKTLKLID